MAERPRVGVMLRHITAPGGVTVFTKRVVRYLLTHPDGIEYHLLYSDEPQQKVRDLPRTHVVLADRPGSAGTRSPRRGTPSAGLSLLFNTKFSVPLLSRVPTLIVIPGASSSPWRGSSPGTTAGTTSSGSPPSAEAPPRSSPIRRSAGKTA